MTVHAHYPALKQLAAISLIICASCLMQTSVAQTPKEVSPQAKATVEQFMKGESVFIENKGQWSDASIRFALNSIGANVGLTDTGPRFQLFSRSQSPATQKSTSRPHPDALDNRPSPAPAKMHEFRAVFDGANKTTPEPRAKTAQTFNYLVGEVSHQRQNVPSYATVWYTNLYPGIDLELKGRRTGLKYNFHLSPGADPSSIRIRYENIEKLTLTPDHTLQITPAKDWSPITDGAPYIYQDIDGKKITVEGRYRLINNHTYGFEITGQYDKSKPLIIDPEVVWGTYLGGSGDDYGQGIAVDSGGNIYTTGSTSSSGWISGGWDPNPKGLSDAYVVKLSPAGGHLWSTYLGGSASDFGSDIHLDANGVYTSGYTFSSGWVSGGGDITHNGRADAYIVKLRPDGSHFWSTYLGGTENDIARGLAVDNETIYVTGTSSSSGWVTGGWDTEYSGQQGDGFLVKLNSAGVHVWSSYLGNSSSGYGIALDSNDNIYVTGGTWNTGWGSGGWDNSYGGSQDGYLLKISSTGAPLWSTYLGGSASDYGRAVAVDQNDNVYATGTSSSPEWVSGGSKTSPSGQDAYIAKMNSEGEHLWSTYLGGYSSDEGLGIFATSGGDIYAVGNTNSPLWVKNGWDTSHNGLVDGYLCNLSPDGIHQWSSYIGGTGADTSNAVAPDDRGNLYVTGATKSSDWLSGGWDTSYDGGDHYGDGYLVKISNNPTGDLRITLSPPTAIASGAQWRRAGTETWHNSGDTETNVPVGDWSIEFKDLPGWAEPELTVTVTSGETTEATAEYATLEADLFWGTYLGGSGYDYCSGVTVDGSGNVYATGSTQSSGWISGGWDSSYGGQLKDGYVAKFSSSGAHLWSSYLGGSGDEVAMDIVVDLNGNVFAAGYTESPGWISGGWQTIWQGPYDGYLVKLSSAGAHLWSTYLGGTAGDTCYDIAVDVAGDVFATGYTHSAGWVNGGWKTDFSGGSTDGYVVKLDAAGRHVWSSYLGGTSDDLGRGAAVDDSGNIYICGTTSSANGISGGWDTSYGGLNDGFLMKISSTGSHLWSSYLGGSSEDRAQDVIVGETGKIYVTGESSSPGWISHGGDASYNGDSDAFVVNLTSEGAHLWSTYLGGTNEDVAYGIAVDDSANVYVAGMTKSPNWANNGFDTTFGGGAFADAFLAKLSPEGNHLWSSYLGSSDEDFGSSVALDAHANIYTCGHTASPGWLEGGWDTSHSGRYDGFLVRVSAMGSLRITLSPAQVIAEGAQWRRVGTEVWRNSGDVEAGVPVGEWPIEFKDLPNWIEPELTTTVTLGMSEATAVYRRGPSLSWGTYLGGVGDEFGYGLAVDDAGNVYATGYTYSSGWVSGGWDDSFNNDPKTADAYVLRLSPAGDHLWSSYLGGAANDYGYGLALDSQANVYVTGTTESPNWISGGGDTSANGAADGFIAKLSSSGAHVWSSYLGGADSDYAYGIASDAMGNLCVTGYTYSADWISGGWDTSYGGSWDGFVAKFSPAGSHQWSSYLGGSGGDYGQAIALDSNGDIYVTGHTASSGWVSGGWKSSRSGIDAYLIKLNSSGSHQWSSYLGGSGRDYGTGIALDSRSDVYATGTTASSGWVSGGWDLSYGGDHDGYVVKLSSAGAYQWSTYLGGNGYDNGHGIAVDRSGSVYAIGQTPTADWVSDGWDTSNNGDTDGYVVKLSSSGTHQWSSCFGGSNNDGGRGIAIDRRGNLYATGFTYSPDWLSGGWDTSWNRGYDAFVLSILAVEETAAQEWSRYE